MLLQLHAETFRGPVGRAPSLHLALWLLWDGPGRPWRLSVVERLDDFSLVSREDAVAAEEVEALRERLLRAGLGRRAPRVSAKTDSSDTAGCVRVRALLGTSTPDWHEVVIPMLSSGFEGQDADALRDFLRRLLAAAGVRSREARWATLGEGPGT